MSSEQSFENAEQVRQVLAAQPFSQVLGAELIRYEPGYAELQTPIRDELKQHHGFVHGGAVSALADLTLTCAGTSLLGDGVTSEFKINFVRPAVGELLIARAQVVHAGRRQAVCRCDLFVRTGTNEKQCAVAQGTIAKLIAPDAP